MMYKVFLVEDEIVTREGIRENVDWQASQFEFCGEAPDGEAALPLLQAARPNVLITDIRMPFMDGLQLCKIVRERMPWVKVIVLSGHDEFEYAQQAIKLGVTEYLLKPVTAQDLHRVLQKVAAQLDLERHQQENVRMLQDQIEENRAALRERLLLKLLAGAIPTAEAIEQSQLLGLEITARHYLVVVIRVEFCHPSEPSAPLSGVFDYNECQRVQRIVSKLTASNPDVFLINKDMEELVLIMKGHTLEYLQEERDLLLEQITRQVGETGSAKLVIGIGAPTGRLADFPQSFVEAVVSVQRSAWIHQATRADRAGFDDGVDKAELLQVDKFAIEDYLKCGTREDFDAFFDAFVRPLSETVFSSYIVKNYVLMDIVLTTARFVKSLGGDVDRVVPELDHVEATLMQLQTIEQIRELVHSILTGALAFRDSHASSQHAGMIQQAREYIDHHFMDPDISLNEVAAHVNHSPSHFSAVFSQETGTTFKEYLTEIRLKKAKELLRTTALRSFEISYRVGYGDPHYFSYVFRKKSGLTPTEFRSQSQTG